MIFRTIVFGLALFLSACGGQPSDEQASTKIIGGNLALPESEVTSYTVSIMNSHNRVFCSGSLAENRRLVITAGHCVDDFSSASRLRVGFGFDMNSSRRKIVKVSHFRIHEDYYHEELPSGGDILRNDIAILVLSSDAPTEYQPIPILPPEMSLSTNSVLKLSGFGKTDHSGSAEDFIDGRLREFDAKVVRVFRGAKEFNHRSLQTGSHTCQGDSGGAARILRDGKSYLVGANSRAPIGCRSGGGTFTDVNKHYFFVRDEFLDLTGIDIYRKPQQDDKEKPSVNFSQYTVKRGDSLPRIARSCGMSIERLQRINPSIQGSGILYVGLVLNVDGTCRS